MAPHSTAPRKSIPANFEELFAPHIDAFNFIVEEGFDHICSDIADENIFEVVHPSNGDILQMYVKDLRLGKPNRSDASGKSLMYPHECREGFTTYNAPLSGTLIRKLNGKIIKTETVNFGQMPVMVKSKACNLYGLTPPELVKHREEELECGGFFIVKGKERVLRLLSTARSNFPISIKRETLKNKGTNFSNTAVICRSSRPDRTTVQNLMHYVEDGTIKVSLFYSQRTYYIPFIFLMKAIKETSDMEIYNRLVQGRESNTFLIERIQLMLEADRLAYPKCITHEDYLRFLGRDFRSILRLNDHVSDVEAGRILLKRTCLVHLPRAEDKFNMLILMAQKLFATVNGECCVDGTDSPSMWEGFPGTQVILQVIKNRIRTWLLTNRIHLEAALRDKKKRAAISLSDVTISYGGADCGAAVESFLSTGNCQLEGLDQSAGYSIIAERLNFYRFISHFRSIHRGTSFQEMKTTDVRKLSQEAWGFICPAHTPDGGPCGLLNHLAHQTRIAPRELPLEDLPQLLTSLGMSPISNSSATAHVQDDPNYPVLFNGKVIGHIATDFFMRKIVQQLRVLKSTGEIPQMLEIAYIAPVTNGPYPGLFLYSTPNRMMRPVLNLATNTHEYIGTLEQLFMEIAVAEDEIQKDHTTHKEILPTHFLSVVATLTPYSDHNQSPRNVYQCQMGKQTMGTPIHSFPYRTDNKLYRIQNPQAPIARTQTQDEYPMNDYPHGANAVIAVISYTGYDMEDAMIINKGSYERGFSHGSVYKTGYYDLAEMFMSSKNPPTDMKQIPYAFSNRLADIPKNKDARPDELFLPSMDLDGLPAPGTLLKQGDPLFVVLDKVAGTFLVQRYKDQEDAYVDQVRIINDGRTCVVKYRLNRNPVVGDKFAARHGQKGVLSVLWPQEDMPFTESGITPDIIINPHAYPSRMTIGMLIEIMAAKSGALHGSFQDATPFVFDEKKRAVDYFGEQLKRAGYNYYGNETMYSGTLGVEMKADIFIGICYYQRLRHMVNDKFQVRSVGKVNQLTHQPLKGRKVGGGIRFGEMERDSLLAHGVSYWLQDRLYNCSDAHQALVCKKCGGMLATMTHTTIKKKRYCKFCNQDQYVELINVPYVFNFLVSELAAMNIRTYIETN